MRATCELRFHGKTPEQLATQCPLVAAVLQIGGKPKSGAYRFSVAEAARQMDDGLEEVSAQLQALSANGEAAYELTDRAVGYEILHPPPDLRQLAAALADHLIKVEASSVEKLDTVYGALIAAADCEDDESQGATLRTSLEAYLGGDGTFHVPDLTDVVSKEEPKRLRDDVRELLTTRSGGKAGGAGAMSARAVARVLHGLGSPAYPAQEWRRNDIGKRMWEKYVGTDFNLLVKVASEELFAMRGIPSKKGTK
jgi:ATP-dependent DNA helicase Q4